MTSGRRALFVDRDGVLNDLVFYHSSGEWEAPRTVGEVRVKPEAVQALRRAQDDGWMLFIVTNQPSFAKGKCALQDLEQVHVSIMKALSDAEVSVTKSFVCYHHPESTIVGYGACRCRKPSPFFLNSAAAEYGIDLPQSWMVGDQASDVETGRRAGCRTALILNPGSESKRGPVRSDLTCADLADFVRAITASGDHG